MSARVTVLRGRTSDRWATGARGAEALGRVLAARLGVAGAMVGEPSPPRDGPWQEDLDGARGVLASAGAALDEALAAGDLPVLLASDCTICMGTLPVLARREPGARVLWLDAHGDFNTPDTTASGFLGGMCLAAACGRWDAGLAGAVDPRGVIVSDGRDLDAPERDEMARAGVAVVSPKEVAGAVRGERVFVHLDLDVLDPGEMPASFPASGGIGLGALHDTLVGLAAAADVVGIEITSVGAPDRVEGLAGTLAPFFP